MAKLEIKDLSQHVLEAVRTLKSNIMFSSVDNPIQSIVVTSTEVGAGKTTTSALLGVIMAESDKKTLLVDTDLRRPNLGNTLGGRHEIGLSNILMGEATIAQAAHKTEYENLYFIDSGTIPPNPVALISSQRFRDFMEQAKKEYDIIIYDMSPVGLFIEPALVAADVDGVVLVIGQGQADYRIAKEAKEQLDRARANILGVVLNKVTHKGSGGYYYNRYYYNKRYYNYGYYGYEDRTEDGQSNKKKKKPLTKKSLKPKK